MPCQPSAAVLTSPLYFRLGLAIFLCMMTANSNLSAVESELDLFPVPGKNPALSPEDGTVVTVNPPAFRWVPARHWRVDRTRYVVEYAPDSAFPAASTVRLGPTPYHVAVPTRPLNSGTWYWRYGVPATSGQITWSRTRSFKVAAGLPELPLPTDEQLSRMTDRHPRVLATAANLSGLRRRAAAGDLLAIAADTVKEVKLFAGEKIGSEPEYLPNDNTRALIYTRIYTETRPPMFKMQKAALAYLLTGDSACGAEAKRRVLHFFSWNPRGSTGLFNNDEPALMLMLNGVRAYDWTYDLYTPAERRQIEAAMLTRAADFYRWLIENRMTPIRLKAIRAARWRF